MRTCFEEIFGEFYGATVQEEGAVLIINTYSLNKKTPSWRYWLHYDPAYCYGNAIQIVEDIYIGKLTPFKRECLENTLT